MSKLYPPTISGIIPAFYGTTIVVPFSMNRAVSLKEISGFSLKIKNVNGAVLDIKTTNNINAEQVEFEYNEAKIGHYYKIQLAYIDTNGEIGIYSTVGVIKCTDTPFIEIKDLDASQINNHKSYYYGMYTPGELDKYERMYSSKFILYDENYNIVYESKENLHNSLNDYDMEKSDYTQAEEFHLPYDLELNKLFYIEFIVTTINKMVIHTPKYKVMVKENVSSELQVYLKGELNYDEGFIHLFFKPFQGIDENEYISGKFVISRASSKNNYAWEELKRFEVPSIKIKDWFFDDYTIEQGISYKYGIQQYNTYGIYTKRVKIADDINPSEDKIIKADFEDAFLYDGIKLLKIRFNPKVSSYKNDIPENKTDTMGSKYPYITRNGHVNYKDFPISGLISHQMDDIEKFMTKEELGFHKLPIHRIDKLNGTAEDIIVDIDGNIIEGESFCVHEKYFYDNNLTSTNIAAERIFKNEVLDWLSNGQPKLFKSPTEGNFIVRLMNVSLSPNDTLGRMLHSFSCNAYEIAECNIDNLSYYKLVNEAINFDSPFAVNTTPLHLYIEKEKTEKKDGYYIIKSEPAYMVYFEDFYPGTRVKLDNSELIIGATGNYYYEGKEPIILIGVCAEDYDKYHVGSITHRFKLNIKRNFDNLYSVKTYEVPISQFIGGCDVYDKICPQNSMTINEITTYYILRFIRKDIDYLYIDGDKKYYDYQGKQEIKNEDLLPTGFYILKKVDTQHRSFIDYGKDESNYLNQYYTYNGQKWITKTVDKNAMSKKFTITLSNSSLSVWDKAMLEYSYDEINAIMFANLDTSKNINSIEIGDGVICEIGYTRMEKNYLKPQIEEEEENSEQSNA